MIPSRRAPARRTARAAILRTMAGLALLAPGAVPAQEAGLPVLTLDLSQSLEGPLSGGADAAAVTGLGLSFLDATPTERLSFAAAGSLRLDDDDEEDVLDGPVLTFGYDRQGAGESLSVEAVARRDEVDDIADLSDFVGDDGVIVLPPDFDALEGTGTRQELSADAALALRQDRPLALAFSAGITDLTYEDASSPDLQDGRRLRLGTEARLALGGGRTATVGLRYGRLDEDGEDPSETLGLDLGAGADLPRGPVSATLSLDRTDDGTRAGASLGRTLAFPTGALSGSLGVARGEDGDLFPTASLSLRREVPGGALSLSAAQALRDGDDDEEERATTLSARYDRALAPRLGLTLDALYAATDPTGEGGTTEEAEVGAALRYALTSAWSLDGGVRGSLDEDDEDEDGATAFLGLSRRFQGTF